MQRSVLVIDDEVVGCLLLSAYLRRRGFSVDVSHTLEEGLSRLHEKKHDYLLLDNYLPDQNGWKYVQLIKGLFPALHIVLITGGDDAVHPAVEGVRKLIKPMNFAQLDACLKVADSTGM